MTTATLTLFRWTGSGYTVDSVVLKNNGTVTPMRGFINFFERQRYLLRNVKILWGAFASPLKSD